MADVSVVIPCYNGDAFIAQTIASVLAQTDPPREVIVIDDGSTDDSARVIGSCAHSAHGPSRVRLIQQPNRGESKARNVGIETSSGAWVAFLDADDLWVPQKLARQLDLIARLPPEETAGVHTRVFNFDNDLDDRGREETERTLDDPSVEDLMRHHHVTPSTLLVRRGVLLERGIRFDESVRHSEDMLFAADLRLAGRLRLVDEPLAGKRAHAGQQSRDPWHAIWSLRSRVMWCRRRAATLGATRAEAVEQELGRRMIQILEDRYWRRQAAGFRQARQAVAALFPQLLAESPVANRRLWPRWIYRLRDGADRAVSTG